MTDFSKTKKKTLSTTRIKSLSNKLFEYQGIFDKYPKNKGGNLCPLIVIDNDKFNEWMDNLNEWQCKIDNGKKFTCKLCKITTNQFNFTKFDNTVSSPERMWCIECEEWWENPGFDIYLNIIEERHKYRENKDNIKFQKALSSLDK